MHFACIFNPCVSISISSCDILHTHSCNLNASSTLVCGRVLVHTFHMPQPSGFLASTKTEIGLALTHLLVMHHLLCTGPCEGPAKLLMTDHHWQSLCTSWGCLKLNLSSWQGDGFPTEPRTPMVLNAQRTHKG